MNCNCLEEIKRVQKSLVEQQRTGNFKYIAPIKFCDITKVISNSTKVISNTTKVISKSTDENPKQKSFDQQMVSKVFGDRIQWYQFLHNRLPCTQTNQ